MSSIRIVNRNTDRVIGILNNRGRKVFKDDLHAQDIETKENTFRFAMPAAIKEAAYFDDLVSVFIPKEDGDFAEFIAFQSQNFGRWKSVIAVASYVDIEKQKIIPAGTYTGNLRELLAIALDGTDHAIGEVEFVGDRTLELEDSVGAYTFVKRLMTLFDVELDASITYSGPRITGRYLNFYTNIGRNGKKEITRGKDLISIERLINNEDIVTAIQAEGPIREDGTRLTVFVSDDAAFQRWNLKGEHRVAVYRPDSEDQNMSLERLTQLAEMELKKRIASIFDYIIEHADISNLFPHEKLWIGDRCRVKDTESFPPLYAEARVKRVERSIVDKRKKKVKIGEVVTYTEDEIMKKFRGLAELYQTKVIRFPTPPPVKQRTIWIKSSETSGGAEVAHIASNGTWVPITPTGVVEVGRNYNGWYFDETDGLIVYRDDNLVRIVLDSVTGIKIQRRNNTSEIWKDVFTVGADGNMMLIGEMFTPSTEEGFGGAWYGDGGWYIFGEASEPTSYATNRGMFIDNNTISGSSVEYILTGVRHVVRSFIGGPISRTLEYLQDGIELRNATGSLLSALRFIDDKIHVTGIFETESYNTPALSNGWQHFSTTAGEWQRAAYWKDLSGVVRLTGMIKDGTTTNATLLFTLPTGYRPAKNETFLVVTSTGEARIDVYSSGQVRGSRGLDSTFTSLSGITFKAV